MASKTPEEKAAEAEAAAKVKAEKEVEEKAAAEAKEAADKAEAEAKALADKEAAEEVARLEAEKEALKGDSVNVTWRGNSRTYSKDLHGKEFRALAKEFATKVDGKLS